MIEKIWIEDKAFGGGASRWILLLIESDHGIRLEEQKKF